MDRRRPAVDADDGVALAERQIKDLHRDVERQRPWAVQRRPCQRRAIRRRGSSPVPPHVSITSRGESSTAADAVVADVANQEGEPSQARLDGDAVRPAQLSPRGRRAAVTREARRVPVPAKVEIRPLPRLDQTNDVVVTLGDVEVSRRGVELDQIVRHVERRVGRRATPLPA